MATSPTGLSPRTHPRWANLVAAFCETHGVDEPQETDLMMLEQIVGAQAELDIVTESIAKDGITVAGAEAQPGSPAAEAASMDNHGAEESQDCVEAA